MFQAILEPSLCNVTLSNSSAVGQLTEKACTINRVTSRFTSFISLPIIFCTGGGNFLCRVLYSPWTF